MIQNNSLELYDKIKIIFSNKKEEIELYYSEVGMYFNNHDGNYIIKHSKLKEIEALIASYIELWIQDYRNLWKNTLPGKMGDKQACLSKMIDFFVNTEFVYSKDQIMNAAKAYVYDTKDYKYLQQADYFIYKTISGNISSRLLSYLESLEDATQTTFSGDNIV